MRNFQDTFESLKRSFISAFTISMIVTLMLKFSLQNSLQSFESLFLRWCERLQTYGNLK